MLKRTNKEGRQCLWGFPRPEITWIVLSTKLLSHDLNAFWCVRLPSRDAKSMLNVATFFKTAVNSCTGMQATHKTSSRTCNILLSSVLPRSNRITLQTPVYRVFNHAIWPIKTRHSHSLCVLK